MIDDLKSIGDRELHVVKGKIPAGEWRIPVFIDYFQSNRKEFAKVTPAVPLMADQQGFLYYTFSLHNAWKKRDVFLVERHFLEQFTEKAPGITPEYYFRWPNQQSIPFTGRKRLKIAQADIANDEFSEETEDFIEFVRKRRSIDANVIRLSIDLIAREATYYLTQKKKPIDLGFVKIHAVPYRANWKEILLARFRDIAWVFNSGKETKENALRVSKFYEHLCTLELMAIDRYKRHIHWTIEAVPTKLFEEETAEIEMTKQAGGDTIYIKMYEKLVSAISPRLVEIFANYVQKASRAFPQISNGLTVGSQKLVPYAGPKRAVPQSGRNIPCHVVVETGPTKLSKRERDSQLLVSPVNGLPKMPSLPAGASNLRERQIEGQVVEPTDEQAGDVRLPLLRQVESEPEGFKLLSLRPKEGADPMANGT